VACAAYSGIAIECIVHQGERSGKLENGATEACASASSGAAFRRTAAAAEAAVLRVIDGGK
jgi:hypothetical protein